MDHIAAVLRDQLADQARSCGVMGSPLYAGLLRRAADEVIRTGPLATLLRPHVRPGRGEALALRLMAAVHRLVLTGAANELARWYPSAGGEAAPRGAWPAFRRLVARQQDELGRLLALPCQTNEVGRAAGLVFGFLDAAARAGMPLRLLELGASAGLNLRWDAFRYGSRSAAWGPRDSKVDLTGLWLDAPPVLPQVTVVERRGCDRQPVDALDEEGRLRLRSSVWADQVERLRRLEGACFLVAEVPATVEQAPAEDWLSRQLAAPRSGVLTVVYHSVVLEYLTQEARRAVQAAIRGAGARASASAPLAWVRLEPLTSVRHHGVTTTLWPGGDDRLLAECGAHGSEVRRARSR